MDPIRQVGPGTGHGFEPLVYERNSRKKTMNMKKIFVRHKVTCVETATVHIVCWYEVVRMQRAGVVVIVVDSSVGLSPSYIYNLHLHSWTLVLTLV